MHWYNKIQYDDATPQTGHLSNSVCSLCLSILQVKYTGFRAITAGLQADTFIEAFDIEKQKQEYSALMAAREEHAAMVIQNIK